MWSLCTVTSDKNYCEPRTTDNANQQEQNVAGGLQIIMGMTSRVHFHSFPSWRELVACKSQKRWYKKSIQNQLVTIYRNIYCSRALVHIKGDSKNRNLTQFVTISECIDDNLVNIIKWKITDLLRPAGYDLAITRLDQRVLWQVP